MTYLTARRLTADPFLEIYENKSPNEPPVQLSYDPPLPGPVDKVAFSPDQKAMAVVSDLRIEMFPDALGNPNNTHGSAGDFVFSTNSTHLLFMGSVTGPVAPALYRKFGPFFQYVSFPGESLTAALRGAAMTANAQLIACGQSTVVKFYQKSGDDQWAFLADRAVSFAPLRVMSLGDEYMLATNASAAAMWQIADQLPVITLPVAGPVYAAKKMSGGQWRFLIRNTTTTLRVYDYDGTTFTLVQTLTISGTGSILAADITTNGDAIVVYFNVTTGSTANVHVFGFDGASYVSTGTFWPATQFQPANTSIPSVLFSADGQSLGVGFGGISAPGNRANLYKRTAAATPTYALAISNTTSTNRITAFSPDGAIGHFQNLHVSTASPYGTLAQLPFAPGVAASTINMVVYAPDNVNLGWREGATFQGAARDGGGGYIDYRELDGTFVTLYDRDVDTFVERDYVQHILGTVVTDIVFSATAKSMSYHCSSPDTTRNTGLGRFVYDISNENFDLRGTIWREGDIESLIAYSPAEDYFVVTYDNSDADTTLRLYKFATGYEYAEVDRQGVMFGPPAYSYCETILVAHGGAVPYSLFAHVNDAEGDRLVWQVVPVVDWANESVFLAAAFTKDCQGVVLIEDDKVIIVDDPEDPEVVDQEPIEEPLDEDDDIEFVPDPDDDETIIVIVPVDPTENYPPVYVVDDTDKTVNNIVYYPYVVSQVTFRTW